MPNAARRHKGSPTRPILACWGGGARRVAVAATWLRSQCPGLRGIQGEAVLHPSEPGEARFVRASGGLAVEQFPPLCDRRALRGGDRVTVDGTETRTTGRIVPGMRQEAVQFVNVFRAHTRATGQLNNERSICNASQIVYAFWVAAGIICLHEKLHILVAAPLADVCYGIHVADSVRPNSERSCRVE